MSNRPKPKVLADVSSEFLGTGGISAFGVLTSRINLSKRSVLRIPLTKSLRLLVIAASAVFFIFGSVAAPTMITKASSTTSTASGASAERQSLEAQLSDLENQINQYEGQIVGYQKQGSSLKGEISQLNDKIAKLNLQMQAINLTLSGLDTQISQTQSQINITQADIESKNIALEGLLNSLYENDNTSLLEVFLKHPQLSDFWGDLQNMTLLENGLRVAVSQITDLKSQLQSKEDQFAASRADAESAKAYQAAQKSQVASVKEQKNQLLAETQGQESKYQALLTQTKESAAQIRSRIFQLLGGGQLSFEQAYEYAKLASDATGVEPSLILAVLDRESALGQNVGKCSYTTAMSPANRPLFLELTKELNLNPDVMMVSCPNSDGAYGGAMGPAQFIPSTWNLYASSVSKITGDSPASPWNNADAFVATALYLRDAMTGCKSVYIAEISQERCTAAKYYAGGRWRNYLWTYGEAVVSRAEGFAQDIATITG